MTAADARRESAMTPQEMLGRLGEVIGTSDWIVVDQDRIDAFADVTGDHNAIHVDREAARATPFGTTIAHGFLTMSLLTMMAQESVPLIDVKMGLNYGFNRLRFISPVKAGKRIRGHFTLAALVEKRPGEWEQTLEATVEIEGEDKPALSAEWLSRLFV